MCRSVCWDRCLIVLASLDTERPQHAYSLANIAAGMSSHSPQAWSNSLSQTMILYSSLISCGSLYDMSSRCYIIPRYFDVLWFLPFCVQGCSSTCCVHLPSPNHLQPEWEWALPTFGAWTGVTLLRGWAHPKVTGICYIWYLSVWHCECGCFLSTVLCYFSSKGEECDDMNSVNGDGCSSQCKKEPFFNCVGKSYESLCPSG